MTCTVAPRVDVGRVVGQRYEIVRRLAGGAHASVWIARHKRLEVEVAVKFLHEAFASRQGARAQFAKEARTAASIRSRHVVRIFDYGVDHEGCPYIVMELLQGEDLRNRIRRCHQLPVDVVSEVLTQACKGLSRAHAAGIVHRDIKPHNIFLSETVDEAPFQAKLLDFGVAAWGLEDLEQTPHGTLIGTPLYMSPEQALGGEVDHRSDLYSLATSIYHALAGRPPFRSKNIPHLMASIITEPAPNIARFCPSLPPDACAWFHKALQKKPSARFSTAREMAETFWAACCKVHASEWSSPAIDLVSLLEARRRYVERSIEPAPSHVLRAHEPADDEDEGVNAEATLSVSDLELDALMAGRRLATSQSSSKDQASERTSAGFRKRNSFAAVALITILAFLAGIVLGRCTAPPKSDDASEQPMVSGS